MSVGLSPATANSVLDALCNQTNWSAPTALWMKLHTGDPGAAGTGNAAVETTRQEVTSVLAAAASGQVTSDTAVTWTAVAATEDYTHYTVWSASSGGTFYWSGTIAANSVIAGDTFTLNVADIDVTLNVAGASTVGLAAATADALLDALCNQTNYTAPTAIWVQLHAGQPGAAGTGNAAAETTRKDLTAVFPPAASGAITTNVAVAWTAVAATEEYTHYTVWSASSGGTFYWSGVTTANQVTVGELFTVPAGDLTPAFNVAA